MPSLEDFVRRPSRALEALKPGPARSFMSGPTENYALNTRAALPGSLPYLLETYPQEGWRRHENFGELAASWLQIHGMLEAAGAQLRQATVEFRAGIRNPPDFHRDFARQTSQFLQHLDFHHQIEDHYYFAKFRALDRRMAAGLDLLESDHKIIHEARLTSAKSAQELLESLCQSAELSQRPGDAHSIDFELLLALLTLHLADEEDLIVPALLHYGEHSLG